VNEVAVLRGVTRQAVWAAIAAGRLQTVEIDVPSVRVPLKAAQSFTINPKRQEAGKRNQANGKKARGRPKVK